MFEDSDFIVSSCVLHHHRLCFIVPIFLTISNNILVVMEHDSSAATIKLMNQDLVKLDRFDGTNFTRWQDKLKFLLTALKIVYILDPELVSIPEPTENDTEDLIAERKKRAEDNFICRGHILNALTDRLYDLYTETESAKEIWNALENKYKTEEEGTKKFLIAKYFDFKMLDDKSILAQVHELQVIVNKLRAVKIDMPEPFQVGAIIAKLPQSWNGYRKKLLHSSEDYSLEKIQKHLRIEEESRIREKAENSNIGHSKANAVSKPKSNKAKGDYGPKKDQDKFKTKGKPNGGGCFVCGKPGHIARFCRQRKGQGNEANVTTTEENIVATISEVLTVNGKIPGWWYDTCATVHVSYDKSLFKTYVEVSDGQEIQMGNEGRSRVVRKRDVELVFTSGKRVTLTNVLHGPEMNRNLVSGVLLGKPGIKCVFESGNLILSRNGIFVGKGYSTEGMVKLCIVDNIINNKKFPSVYMIDSVTLWHSRLAHIGISTMKRLISCGMISCNVDEFNKCEICIKSKMTKKPFHSVERNTNVLDLVHSDLCELNGMLTRGGNRYFITFIDDCSRFTYVYLLKHKDEAFNAFKVYKAEVENQLGKKIKTLRSDRGGEYFPNDFTAFCEENGIIHECSAPRTPQQNGLAERKNRTFLEMINALLLHAELPFNLWGEALFAACHILNRIPMKKKKISPYEIWKGRKPNIGYFKVWGCLAYCKNLHPNRTKLGPRGIRCAFVGYANNSKAYRLLDLESNVIIESREVEFFENLTTKSNDHQITMNEGSREENSSRVVEPQQLEPWKSKRVRKAKDLGPDEIDSQRIFFYLAERNRENMIKKVAYVLQVEDDPKTFTEAMASRDSIFWKEAINDEMDSIMSNYTWELVDLPKGSKAIGCKWVFRRKYHSDGTLNTYKARLVAKGFRQREGIDYFDTYAPVARLTTIRVLFALASLHNLYVHQMDVKTAFLNGDLDEEVYMEQSEGFVLPENEQKVCKLVKSLYGLKQAPKQWHEKFDSVILSNGFVHNISDKCLYTKEIGNVVVYVCLYVDDMLIISNEMKGVLETKRFLSSTFKMKDLGVVDTILGIKVKQNSGSYELSQSHYVEKVLDKFKHLTIKEVNTPFDPSLKLEKHSGRAVAQLEYSSAIGCLMYLMQCTRPDIAFAVSKLSRFTSNPNVEHWKAIERVLGYLAKTKILSLQYLRFPAILEGYTDASWISSVGDNKSTTGWVFTLAGGAISWKSKKQTCITHSTMESEFVALASAGQEAEWLRDLLIEIHLAMENASNVSIHCDSQATLARAYSEVYNGKSRHISLRHEYVRKLIKDGIISLTYVRSSYNLADPFTKPLTRELVKTTSRGMGLKLLE